MKMKAQDQGEENAEDCESDGDNCELLESAYVVGETSWKWNPLLPLECSDRTPFSQDEEPPSAKTNEYEPISLQTFLYGSWPSFDLV